MSQDELKLDKIDLKILYELDKNCRTPLTQLAKKVRKSRQSVEYRINQLIKNEIIISFDTSINPCKLGYKIYKNYLQLRNVPDQKNRLISYLKGCGKVYWFGECDGEWNIIFGIFAKTDYEFYELKNEILTNFNEIIIKHKGTILLDAQQYPKMYFTNQISNSILFGGQIEFFKLKDIDKKILSNLVKNAKKSIVELSRKVNSTPIIVRNRMKILEKAGVITQYRISVNLEKLGKEFFKAIISLDKQNRPNENKLSAFASQLSSIQYFIRNLWDIEIELIVDDYTQYNYIINKIKEEFPNIIRNVETVIMKSDIWLPSFIV